MACMSSVASAGRSPSKCCLASLNELQHTLAAGEREPLGTCMGAAGASWPWPSAAALLAAPVVGGVVCSSAICARTFLLGKHCRYAARSGWRPLITRPSSDLNAYAKHTVTLLSMLFSGQAILAQRLISKCQTKEFAN